MWIRTISPEAARGKLAQLYAAAIERAGRVFAIVRAMSLAPDTLSASLALYRQVMFGTSDLTRAQREMLAVVVSRANRCHY